MTLKLSLDDDTIHHLVQQRTGGDAKLTNTSGDVVEKPKALDGTQDEVW